MAVLTPMPPDLASHREKQPSQMRAALVERGLRRNDSAGERVNRFGGQPALSLDEDAEPCAAPDRGPNYGSARRNVSPAAPAGELGRWAFDILYQ